MRRAGKKIADLGVKQEIVAAATLAPGVDGQMMNIEQFADRFGLSEIAKAAIIREMPHAGVAAERFRFNADEFARQVPFKTVELSSGAILTASATDFDEVFEREEVEGGVRYSTVGRIVTEKLEKA